MPQTDTGEIMDALPPGAATDTPAAPTLSDENTPAATPDPQPSSGPGDAPENTSEPKSMADAVAAAFDASTKPDTPGDAPDTDTPAAPAKPKGEGEAGDKAEDPSADTTPNEDTTGTDDTELPDPTDDELRAFKPQVQRRIKQLLSQRNAARKDAETYQPDADRYQSIRKFMAENALADTEVADLFKAGADLKSGDPKRLQAFLDRVQPLVQMALEATGQAVPADLRTQVDSGELTEAAAAELARARHNASVAQAQAQRSAAQVQQVNTGARQAQIAEAVRQWTVKTQASDPDFALKTDVMRRVAQGIVAERGLPQSPEQAVQFSRDAHAEATRLLKAARPTPQATRPNPSSSTAPSRSGVAPAPTSLADAIGRALDAST